MVSSKIHSLSFGKKHRQLLKMSNIPLLAIRSRAYGVWQKGSGLNQRGRFIINPDGIIMGVVGRGLTIFFEEY